MAHELKLNGLTETPNGYRIYFGCRCGADYQVGNPDDSIPSVPADPSKAAGIACSRTGKQIGAVMDGVLIDHRGQRVRRVFTPKTKT